MFLRWTQTVSQTQLRLIIDLAYTPDIFYDRRLSFQFYFMIGVLCSVINQLTIHIQAEYCGRHSFRMVCRKIIKDLH